MNMTTLIADNNSMMDHHERETSPIPSMAYITSSMAMMKEDPTNECSSSSSSSSSNSTTTTPMTTTNSLPFYMTPPPPTTSSSEDYDTMMQEYQQFPSIEEFNAIVNDYLQNLSSKKRDKALVDSHRYKLILQVLKDPRNTAISTAQFRFWVKKMFRLSTSEYMEFVCHDDKPVATREDIYNILIIAHKEAHHGGRDKTSALVRKRYSWIPKELIARFVRHCPFCISRRNGQTSSIKNDYHSPPPLTSAALLNFLSSPATPATPTTTTTKKRKQYQSHHQQPHWSNRNSNYSYDPNYSMAAHVATSAAAAAVAISSSHQNHNSKPLHENPFDFYYSTPLKEDGDEAVSPKPNLFSTPTSTAAATTTLPPYSYLLFSTNSHHLHQRHQHSPQHSSSNHTSSSGYNAPSSAAAAAVVAAAAMAAVNSNQPVSPTISSGSCASSLDQPTANKSNSPYSMVSLHASANPSSLTKESETTTPSAVSERATPTFITTC